MKLLLSLDPVQVPMGFTDKNGNTPMWSLSTTLMYQRVDRFCNTVITIFNKSDDSIFTILFGWSVGISIIVMEQSPNILPREVYRWQLSGADYNQFNIDLTQQAENISKLLVSEAVYDTHSVAINQRIINMLFEKDR